MNPISPSEQRIFDLQQEVELLRAQRRSTQTNRSGDDSFASKIAAYSEVRSAIVRESLQMQSDVDSMHRQQLQNSRFQRSYDQQTNNVIDRRQVEHDVWKRNRTNDCYQNGFADSNGEDFA